VLGATRRSPKTETAAAVAYGYPAQYQQPVQYQYPTQPPAQYPNQPPVTYNPPATEGFDHPTQAMPPIQTSPEPVGPFEQEGWSVPGQPWAPPQAPAPKEPDESQDQ